MPVRSTTIALALAILTMLPAHAAPTVPFDTSWRLSALSGQPDPLPGKATLNFEDGRVHGSDGCNRFAGSYTSTGTEFRMGDDMISTNMACPEPIMAQAEVFRQALKSASALMLGPERLVLLDSEGNALATFTALPNTLADTSWVVTGYNNGKQAVVSVAIGTKLTATFKADGKLGGSAGCNRYSGLYTIDGKAVSIGPLATTRKSCDSPVGVMAQEARFLKALSTAATWRMDGDRLELRTSKGALAVTASAASAP
jgi:heat shock protein HslJ